MSVVAVHAGGMEMWQWMVGWMRCQCKCSAKVSRAKMMWGKMCHCMLCSQEVMRSAKVCNVKKMPKT